MSDFVQPRNLTARAAHQVVGNPTSTRMESGVANCFPGLEWDIRELDRRFFPGLVFQFIQTPLYPVPGILPVQQGAKLAWIDSLHDPALPFTSDEDWVQKIRSVLEQNIGQINPLSRGRWYLESFTQHGKTFRMEDESGTPYEGEMVWRMIRGIEAGIPLSITIRQRSESGDPTGSPVTLDGFRRQYLDVDGVVDSSFKPGELTMSMCNPWSHDFRDCACHYWASNHPDVVLGPDDTTLDDGQPADAVDAQVKLDWIRRDRSPAGRVAAEATITENRPFEIDHFEMNERWQELPFVLEGREIGAVYSPKAEPRLAPGTIDDLRTQLRTELAPLEFTLAIQYLYAMFSVRSPEEVDADRWPDLPGDVAAIRQFILLVAVSEMQHLRWANRLLWELDEVGEPGGPPYEPVLHHVESLQGAENAQLAPLTLDTLDRFIRIERPGGRIDSAYAQAVATLEATDGLEELLELAIRIDTDGNEHYSRFRDIRGILEAYPADGSAWLRPVELGSGSSVQHGQELFEQLVDALGDAYKVEAAGNAEGAQQQIADARTLMRELQAVADQLAADGIGLPFWGG